MMRIRVNSSVISNNPKVGILYTPAGPCGHGHVAERYVKGNVCVECRRLTVLRRHEKTVDSRREQQAAWRAMNLGQVREKDRVRSATRYHQNPESIKAANARWWKNNPDKRRGYKAARRARELDAPGCYLEEDIQALLGTQQGVCAAPHCEEKIEHLYHVDHIDPLVNGGTNWPDNLQLLCPTCNCSKGAKSYQVWCEERINAR